MPKCDDPLDRLGKAHVEHLVGLVEHQRLERRQVAKPLFDQIEQTAGRRDDDVDARLERLDLVELTDAAEDRHHARLQVAAEALEPGGDLRHEFARRREDEDARAPLGGRAGIGGEPVEQRQRERGGLARAGLRHAEHVAALQQLRDRLRLDRRRVGIALFGERLEQEGRQGEVGEGRGHGKAAPPALGKAAPGRA
jgi:hypothetical protein